MARRKSTPEHNAASRLKKRQQNERILNKRIIGLQNCDIPLIPKLPFSRLVREIMQQHKDNYRITAAALVGNIKIIIASMSNDRISHYLKRK